MYHILVVSGSEFGNNFGHECRILIDPEKTCLNPFLSTPMVHQRIFFRREKLHTSWTLEDNYITELQVLEQEHLGVGKSQQQGPELHIQHPDFGR